MGFEVQVLKLLYAIKSKVNTCQGGLNLLLSQTMLIDDNTNDHEDLFCNLPVTFEEDLQKLEDTLNSKPEYILKLTKVMAGVGGTTVKEVVRRIMPRLIDDQLAAMYSFVGRKGKRKFSPLVVMSVIKSAVKTNPHTKNVTEKEIEECVSIWLVKAPDRLNRKNKKDNTDDIYV